MYKFYFKYNYKGEEKRLVFPLAPESLFTDVKGCNKIINTIGLGEVNVVNDMGLRDLEFKVFLPKSMKPFYDCVMENEQRYPPIYQLAALREIMANKCIVTLIIERTTPDGNRIFEGNMKVTVENYFVEENAGEEGCFWVNIKIKEYKDINAVIYEPGDDDFAVEVGQRNSKETAKSYVVKPGDSLWKIAKTQLNDGSRYKEIAQLNNIANPDRISVGMTLLLP